MDQASTERRRELSALLKRACKGKGLDAERDDADLTRLGAPGWKRLALLVRSYATLNQRDPRAVAIACALRRDDNVRDMESLTERREVATKLLGVSMRTVMRLEEDGADQLAAFVDELTHPSSFTADDLVDLAHAALWSAHEAAVARGASEQVGTIRLADEICQAMLIGEDAAPVVQQWLEQRRLA